MKASVPAQLAVPEHPVACLDAYPVPCSGECPACAVVSIECDRIPVLSQHCCGLVPFTFSIAIPAIITGVEMRPDRYFLCQPL